MILWAAANYSRQGFLIPNFLERIAMNDIDNFLQLPLTAQVAAICFVICASGLLVLLLAAPRRDCFFLRWTPPMRFLALIASPTLLIVWPIVLYGWFLQSRGIGPEDLDFFDED